MPFSLIRREEGGLWIITKISTHTYTLGVTEYPQFHHEWSARSEDLQLALVRGEYSSFLQENWSGLQGGIGFQPEYVSVMPELPLDFLLEYREPKKEITPNVPSPIEDFGEPWRSKRIRQCKKYIKNEQWHRLRTELDSFSGIERYLPEFPAEKIDRTRGGKPPYTRWTVLYVNQQQEYIDIMTECLKKRDYLSIALKVVQFPELREVMPNFPHVEVDRIHRERPDMLLLWDPTRWQTVHPNDQQKYLQVVQAHLEREKWLGLRFILIHYPEIRDLRPDLPFEKIDLAHDAAWKAARQNPLSEAECAELGEGLSDVWKRVMKEGFWDRGIRKTYAECVAFWESERELGEIEMKVRVDALRERMREAGINSVFDIKFE